jgi:hypothetical protein
MVIALELSIRNSLLQNSYKAGFSTELSMSFKSSQSYFCVFLICTQVTARSEISFRQVTFTGNTNFMENGTTYLERELGSKIYAG